MTEFYNIFLQHFFLFKFISPLEVRLGKNEVEQAVKEAIKAMGYGGGFMISPSNFHPEMSVERLKWMIDATKRFGTYPLNNSLST